MTSLKRCLLVALILQIGCVALDHSISELEYEEDDIRLLVGNNYPTEALQVEDTSSDNESESNVISFHPKFYDFKESPVGMPRMGVVQIDNRLKDENVKLISISGNTVNFHSSFFADKVLTPGNFTSFEVVFLSREEGEFDSVLLIHTSKGPFKYHVRGIGLPNPYRLRPLVGARIPVNGSYEPIITLHNPHDTRIIVVEMLSSGTDFALKLPDAEDEEEEGTAWAIDPFQTKQVMQGSFQGKTEGNHTGFIRIKVNHTVAGEYLMVPVEVQVSSSPGIYSPQEALDFGLLVRSDKPKTLSLNLINAQPTSINVHSVTVKSESNPAIRIEFRPLNIEPDIGASTVVALITFDPSQLSNVDQSNGFIEVRSDCGKSISIPFNAVVMEGELEYNASSLGFSISTDILQTRNFSVRNRFNSAVAIYQVSVNHPEIIQVDPLNQSHIIIPGEQKTICTLKIQRKVALCDSKSSVQLTVKSNVTNLKLPITCYDGKLQLYSIENGQVDFGRVELYSTYTEYIAVQNKNPIEVRLKSWGSNSSWSQVELVGMQKGVMEDLSLIRDFDSLKKSLFLQPGHMAVFSIDIRRPTVEGMFYGESYVTTDQNQTLRAPFRFMVSRGSVSSETIFFDKTFPGKLSFEKLYLTSTFNHTLNLVGLRSYPLSAIWFSSSTLQGYPEISPHRRNFVGKVHFDPRKFCMQDCYTGFSLESSLGQDWVRGLVLNWETGDIDLRIWETLQARFNQIKDEIVSNMSLWVDTSGPTGFKIKSKVRYMWPRLSVQKSIIFPLTALGNETFMDVVIQNPSNSPVVFQAAMAQEYGPAWTNFVMGNTGGGNATEGRLVFSVKDISWPSSQFNLGTEIIDARKKLDKLFPQMEEMQGTFFVLPPTSKASISLRFAPLSKEMSSSLLLLRNNLTGIETVWVKGRAGTGQLTVGNGTPGSSLLFQLTESLLQGCEKDAETVSSSKYTPPQVTVRRSFIARNIGEIPLEILSLVVFPQQESFWSWALGSPEIDGDGCEGYGFRILNCHPFLLQPNQTHSIDIAFTPDFTLSKVRATLMLTDSSGGFFNYTLVSLVPSNMLSRCASVIARPWWEWYLKVGAIIGAIIIFLAASFVLYFEASGVISKTVLATVRVLPRGANAENSQDERDKTQRLDLKAVYDKVENRFKKNQPDCHKGQVTPASQSSKTLSKTSELQTSTLRNRKGKKNDLNSSQNNVNNKPPDKVINSNNVGRNHNPPGAVEEIVATFMNAKKDKENMAAPTNNRKKKGGNNNHQQNQSVTSKLLQNKNEGFNPSSLPNTKAEEETSSTTTESSNPDDVIVTYFDPYDKDKNPKSNYVSNKIHNNNRREKKQQDSSSNENITAEPTSEKSFDDKKKSYMKKRESADSAVSKSTENKRRNGGNISPRSEMNLWDTPRPSSGGLSEFAAQTEAFVMQRPSPRNRSGEEQGLVHLNGPDGTFSFNPHKPPPPFPTTPLNNLNQSFGSQQRPKKPGVIGQPRSTSSVSHPQANFGSHSNSISPPIRTATTGSTGYNNNYNNAYSTINNIPRSTLVTSPGSIWESEMLSDNGCDAWGRRSFDGNNQSASNFFSSNAEKASKAFALASTAQTQNGYGLTNSTSHFNPTSTVTDPHHAFSSSSNRVSQSGNNFAASNPSSGANINSDMPYRQRERDPNPYYYASTNTTFINDLSNNPWQPSPAAFSQQNIVNGVTPASSGLPGTATHTGSTTQHGYLQRMRSDPTLRSQQHPVTSSPIPRPAWIDTIFSESGPKRRESEEKERNTWLPSSQTVNAVSGSNRVISPSDSSFEEWTRAVGPTGTRNTTQESQIWESNAVGSRWPTSFGTTASQSNNFSDSMAVGSGSRLPFANRQEEQNSNINSRDLGIAVPNSDITREVEAGLGFNPFTSNIWNQSGEGSTWGGSSYSQNK